MVSIKKIEDARPGMSLLQIQFGPLWATIGRGKDNLTVWWSHWLKVW